MAKEVANAVFDMLDSLQDDKLAVFLSFLHHLRLTSVFEVLQPSHQHVVNLSHLSSRFASELKSNSLPISKDVIGTFLTCTAAPERVEK